MTFAVLGFIFISGLLFKDVKYPTLWSYIKSKIRTLLIPYFYLSVLFTILDPYLVNPSYLVNILSYPRLHILGTEVSASAESIFEWFCGDIICTVVGISSRSSMPLWFVYMLFFVSIAFYWFNKTIKNNVLLFIVGCVIFVLSWFFNIYHIKFMHCGAFIISLSLFIFGYLFNKYIYEKLLDNKKYKKILQKVLFITFLCGFVYTYQCGAGVIDIVNSMFGSSFVCFTALTFLGIILFIQIFILLDKISFLKYLNSLFIYISKNALVILGVHFWGLVIYGLYILPHIRPQYNILLCISFISLLCFLFISLVNNKFPFLIGKNKK